LSDHAHRPDHAAWYVVWELVLKEIQFLRRLLDQDESEEENKKRPKAN